MIAIILAASLTHAPAATCDPDVYFQAVIPTINRLVDPFHPTQAQLERLKAWVHAEQNPCAKAAYEVGVRSIQYQLNQDAVEAAANAKAAAIAKTLRKP